MRRRTLVALAVLCMQGSSSRKNTTNRRFSTTRKVPSKKQKKETSLDVLCTGERRSRDTIVYLGQKTHSSYDATHKNTLNASMESLRHNMLRVGESDVIVWHEGDLGLEDATALDGVANVRFCLLTKETGWGAPPWLPVVPTMKFSAGYRFMIRFYAVTIWRTLARLGYEWVMRMDDDSFILSPIPYNIFEDMRSNGLSYGYRTLSRECPVIFGDFVDTYATHAHWKEGLADDAAGDSGGLDFSAAGISGLKSHADASDNLVDDAVESMDRRTPRGGDNLDAESRHIIKFCGTWPRHCRKAEMQASLAVALKKANLIQAKRVDPRHDAMLHLHKKKWMTWYCSGPGQLGYYNNWFVTNISWWLDTDAAARMIRAFDRSNLIFSRRCNDLIFQTAVIKLFMPKHSRKRYTDFTYQHHTVSSGHITFGGIETGTDDPNPFQNLEKYREKFLHPSTTEYIKVRGCHVQSVLDGDFRKTYYLSPAADQQKHDSDTVATATVLVNRFESPYCGPDSKMPLE